MRRRATLIFCWARAHPTDSSERDILARSWQGRKLREGVQMSLAPAIRTPESPQPNPGSRQTAYGGGPLMAAGRVPDSCQPRVPAQVVDMPAGALGAPGMVADAGTETSGTEGTTDVQVVSRLKGELAEAADADVRRVEQRSTRT